MPNAYIVEAVRTAGGKRNGRLKDFHPVDLAAAVLDEIVERTGIDGKEVDDVIMGCVQQYGAQAGNIGRYAVVASKKLPLSVPGTTVNRMCGSGQQAVHFAAQAVMSGLQDCVIAAGVDHMSLIPIDSPQKEGFKAGRGKIEESKNIQEKWPGIEFSQFNGAELVAQKYGVTRDELDKWGYMSHVKAHKATQAGRFKDEIVPLKGKNKEGEEVVHDTDEGIRPNTTLEKMKKMKTLQKDGLLTAGTASQICDGAAAMLICSEAGLKRLGLKPRAKLVGLALAGSDPVVMLDGPIPATFNVFKQTGLTMDQMDLYEVNEAFASVPLAWAKETGADLNKLNVNGGACGLGHPLGCTGVKLMVTLLYELEKRKGKYGLQTICEGGGTANATILEICSDPVKSNL
eukprot:maker-scaffold_5-snap-gene-20.9-mRNA-1 protein AED:0.00 eAED:0.00 QI:105/1/1/1/1/1/2/19/400